jgi:hypothetical protein
MSMRIFKLILFTFLTMCTVSSCGNKKVERIFTYKQIDTFIDGEFTIETQVNFFKDYNRRAVVHFGKQIYLNTVKTRNEDSVKFYLEKEKADAFEYIEFYKKNKNLKDEYCTIEER